MRTTSDTACEPKQRDDRALCAFSAEHAVRLSGLSKRELTYWDATRFFRPHFADAEARDRIYSFRDLVSLRTLAILRKDHKVSLPHLRQVASGLAAQTGTPWADLRLAVLNRRVQIIGGDGATVDALDGQYVLMPLADIRDDVRRAADRLRRRDSDDLGKVVAFRKAAPAFAGTRIPVSTILTFLDDGFSHADIIAEFPTLTDADVDAALQHRGTEAA